MHGCSASCTDSDNMCYPDLWWSRYGRRSFQVWCLRLRMECGGSMVSRFKGRDSLRVNRKLELLQLTWYGELFFSAKHTGLLDRSWRDGKCSMDGMQHLYRGSRRLKGHTEFTLVPISRSTDIKSILCDNNQSTFSANRHYVQGTTPSSFFMVSTPRNPTTVTYMRASFN